MSDMRMWELSEIECFKEIYPDFYSSYHFFGNFSRNLGLTSHVAFYSVIVFTYLVLLGTQISGKLEADVVMSCECGDGY